MQTFSKVLKWIFLAIYVLIYFAGTGIALLLFGEAFRAHVLMFALIWISIPPIALFFYVAACFLPLTIKELRFHRAVLMTAVILISCAMLMSSEELLNHIDTNASASLLRWRILQWLALAGVFVFPFITWYIMTAVVEH